MASLSELVMAAETKQAGMMAADPLQSGAKAFSEGLGKGLDKERQLLQAMKVLEIQGKMQEIKHQVFSDKFTRDVIRKQYPGMFPEQEYQAADFGDIGKKGSMAKMIATDLSKVQDVASGDPDTAHARHIPSVTIKSGAKGLGVEFEKAKTPTEGSITRGVSKNQALEVLNRGWYIDGEGNQTPFTGKNEALAYVMKQQQIDPNDPDIQKVLDRYKDDAMEFGKREGGFLGTGYGFGSKQISESPFKEETAISLPENITTTTQARDYLIKTHGMTEKQAIEWIRSQ